MKRLALLLPLLALAAAPARADTIWPPPAHVEEARFTEPAVTIDGEIAATLGDVNRLVFDPSFIPDGRSWARAAQKLADDFLLAREAKKHGCATAWAFIHEGLDPPTDPDARAFWNELREDDPNAPFEDTRKRLLLQDWQNRFAERRAKLLAALRATATIQYAASLAVPPHAEQTHAESAEGAEEESHAERAAFSACSAAEDVVVSSATPNGVQPVGVQPTGATNEEQRSRE